MLKWKLFAGFAIMSLLTSCSLPFAADAIKPGKRWKDTSGNAINAHGGGVLFHDGVYYWFGEYKRDSAQALDGISCYSSTDLLAWKNEGVVLATQERKWSEITSGCIMERPKVIYNKKTGTFVMWFHLELKGQDYSSARTGLAISDKVTGPYTYIRSYRPNAGTWPMNVPDEFKTMKGVRRLHILHRPMDTHLSWWAQRGAMRLTPILGPPA